MLGEPGNFGATCYFTSTLMMEAEYSTEALITSTGIKAVINQQIIM
jgi:hypothetical protein